MKSNKHSARLSKKSVPVVVRISETLWQEVESFMRAHEDEHAAFLHGKITHLKDRTLITVKPQAPMLLDEGCYSSNGRASVKILDEVMKEIYFNFAQSDANVLINIHSHPFALSGTTFSAIDDRDDIAQANYVRDILNRDMIRFDSGYEPKANHVLSLVFDQRSVDARLVRFDGTRAHFQAVNEVQLLSPNFRMIIPNKRVNLRYATKSEAQSRQKAFLKSKSLHWLESRSFVIAGAGGTGSIFGEALLRLGAKHVAFIDDDIVEESNFNRWQSGRPSQIGRFKVDAYTENLRRMFPDAKIKGIKANLYSARAHRAIASADFLIGCVDNGQVRYYLNRLATQYMLPYLDVAVEITVDKNDGVNFIHRTFLSLPGEGQCLECSPVEMIDLPKIRAAYADAATHAALRHTGYITGQEGAPAPSAYALNMHAVSSTLLNLIGALNGKPMPLLSYYHWLTGENKSLNYREHQSIEVECPTCNLLTGSTTSERPYRPLRKKRRIALDSAANWTIHKTREVEPRTGGNL